jgi:hypothetical protein
MTELGTNRVLRACIPRLIGYTSRVMRSLRAVIIRKSLWLIKPDGRVADVRKR